MCSEPRFSDGLPLLGNSFSIVQQRWQFLERIAKLDDLIKLELPIIGPLYQVSDPALIKQVLVTDAEKFTKPEFAWDELGDIVGEGLILNRGGEGKRQRTLIQPAFYREMISGYAKTMRKCAVKATEDFQEGQKVDITDRLKQVTLQTIIKSMFGTDVDYEAWNVRETVWAV